MIAVVYGYAHNVVDMEKGKAEAIADLRVKLGLPRRIWTKAPIMDQKPLPALPGHEPDRAGLTFTPFRHGGQHLQVTYEFDYPALEPTRSIDPGPT